MLVGLLVVLHLTVSAAPIDLDRPAHLTLWSTATIMAAITHGILKDEIIQEPACRRHEETGVCDPQFLKPIDRWVVGNNSKSWRTISDVGLYTALTLPLWATAIDRAAVGDKLFQAAWGDELLVSYEAIALTILTTSLIKSALGRPRPTQYIGNKTESPFGDPTHQRSFPSGHTSSTASATTAFATLFALRHPHSPWRWPVIGGAAAWTALTAFGRLQGGMHFFSDVIGGAALGTAFGILLPLLNRKEISPLDLPNQTTSQPLIFNIGGSF